MCRQILFLGAEAVVNEDTDPPGGDGGEQNIKEITGVCQKIKDIAGCQQKLPLEFSGNQIV